MLLTDGFYQITRRLPRKASEAAISADEETATLSIHHDS